MQYTVITTVETVNFNGKYRRDLETKNWHYYEDDTGKLLHFKKEYMVVVIGGTADNLN
jgi:hypothetical protein